VAGLETVHEIVEKFVVKGTDVAVKGFEKVSYAVIRTQLAYGKLNKTIKDVLMSPIPNSWKKKAEELKSEFHEIGTTATKFLAQKLDLPASLDQVLERAWAVNEAYEDMHDRLTGLSLVATNVTEQLGGRGWSDIQKAEEASTALLDKFHDAAMRSALPVREIEATFSGLLPVLQGTNKSLADAEKFTSDIAAASKVLGTSSQDVLGKIERIALTGKAGRKDALGQMIVSKAGLTGKESYTQRIDKLQGAVHKLAGPVDEITEGTGEWIQRFKTLTDDILLRVTQPVFESIGHVVKRITQYIDGNQDAINGVVDMLHEAWEIATEFADQIWNAVKFVVKFGGIGDFISRVWNDWIAKWTAIVRFVDVAVSAFKVIGTLVDYFAGDKGFGAVEVLLDSMQLKMLKFVNALFNMFRRMAEHIPLLGKQINQYLTDPAQDFMNQISEKELEERVRKGAAREGLSADDLLGKRDVGLSKAEQEQVLTRTKITGKQPLINIQRVDIHQDFRDQEPDAVMYEMTKGFERLSEAAVQSLVGNNATAFGPGASYGGK